MNHISNRSLLYVVIFFITGAATLLPAAGAGSAAMSGCGLREQGADALSSYASQMLNSEKSDSQVELSLPSFSVLAGCNALGLSEWRSYFGSAQLGESTGTNKLSDVKRDELFRRLSGSSFGFEAELQTFALSFRLNDRWALGLRHYLSAQSLNTLPSSLQTLFDGTLGKDDVRIDNARASSLAYTALQVSAACIVMKSDSPSETTIQAGVSLKHLQGIAMTSLDPGSSINVHPYVPVGWDSTHNCVLGIDADYSYAPLTNPTNNLSSQLLGIGSKNQGWASDFSLSYSTKTANMRVQASAALLDLGFVNWDEAMSARLHIIDTIRSALSLNDGYLDKLSPTEQRSATQSSLATRLRAGVALCWDKVWDSEEQICLTSEFAYGLNSIGANEQRLRIACGIELEQRGYRPTLRAGVHTGAYDGTDFSFGFGWRIATHASIEFACANMSALIIPSRAQWLSSAMNWKVAL